jgi:hypothetical protein
MPESEVTPKVKSWQTGVLLLSSHDYYTNKYLTSVAITDLSFYVMSIRVINDLGRCAKSYYHVKGLTVVYFNANMIR